MSENIAYKISLDYLTKHLLNIECRIKTSNSEGQLVSLPAWVPGSYMIRDFGKLVVLLQAECNGQNVPTVKVDKNTWQCSPCNGELIIAYQIYCFDLMPRGAYIDNTRVFFDGCRIFLIVHGEEEQSRSVEIVQPQAAECHTWRCITSMNSSKIDTHGFGIYTANNHLELIDHPFLIGNFKLFEFMVADVVHLFAIDGYVNADLQRLIQNTQQICAGHVEFFGELPPMQRYVFILNVLGKGYGGIEHRSSCSLVCARSDLPIIGDSSMSEEYKSLLGLISHEYFHLWNVKRIKPEVFVNPDLTVEAYTRQLWIFEGFTSYYDNLNLVRNNLISTEDYLKIVQKDINTLLQNPGAYIQTLEDSSFDAWIKFYQPDENSVNTTVSYYLKGSIVALVLDLLIIRHSRRKQSLADVMQIIWQQYGKTGLGLPENYFSRILFEVTGEDFSEFLDLALRTTEALPLPELLLDVGVVYKSVPTDFFDNLGVKFAADQGKLSVRSILYGSAAEQAGLAPNDTLIAVNSVAVNLANIQSVLSRSRSGDDVSLQLFRNDILIELKLNLPAADKTICQLELANIKSAQQELNWQKWLYL